ncbi:MAG: nucleotide exchange factor GrpE [Bacteroidales bacterium]|nr:nucleotide exchange factor GrpE [Clostridium sp.]MCM1202578.1 nucleotide exchange factor GrpE [Bacteroidales bacterium]
MEEKKKNNAKGNAGRKSKPKSEAVEETVEEVAVESTEETEVEAKEVSEDAEKKPVKGKKGNRRGGGNNKALELELEKQKELTEDANDRYKRLLAEFENARNRNEKESRRMYDIGAKEVLEKLLPVVDNFERALQAIPEEDRERAFEQGVDKIYKQLIVTLEEIGVSPMNAEGTEFNPDYHNAVMHVEDEAFGENTVAEELQKGYMYKEDVLRHSMVKVAN